MDLERLLAYLDAPPLTRDDFDDDHRHSSSGSDSDGSHMDTGSTADDAHVSATLQYLLS
jgi:hypothetical protein